MTHGCRTKGSATGVLARVFASTNASVNLTDSIIADPFANSIHTIQDSGATGTASVTTNYSDYDHTTIGLASGTYTPGAQDTPSYVDPKFVNASGGDYRLLAGSTLLNFDATALGATPVGSIESSTDLGGLPRITGTGRDLGAYQHQLPTVAASAAPSPAPLGTPVSFTAAGATISPNDSLSYAWQFDDGGSAAGASATHAFSTPGTHSGTVTVTDGLGFSASATVHITVNAPANAPAPAVANASQSHQTWREGDRLASFARKHKAPLGTTFSFTLNEQARVTLAFTQHVAGRKVKGNCIAQTKKNRKKPSCKRTVTQGTLSFTGHSGNNKVSFQGRISRSQKLKPGQYTLVIGATNTAGQQSTPRLLRFTIVK